MASLFIVFVFLQDELGLCIFSAIRRRIPDD